MTKFEKQMVAKILAATLVISGIVGINQTVSVKAEENANVPETTVSSEVATPDNATDTPKEQEQETPESIVSGSFTYHDDGSGNAVIDSYTGTDQDVTIPEQLDGKTVIAIGENAFSENDEVTSVDVPNTVTSIQYRAFYLTKNLQKVTFQNGSNLKSLADQVFYKSGLSEIQIPEKVDTIGKYAFARSGIKHIVIPGTLTEIAEGVFYACELLETVELKDGIQVIGKSAFGGCEKLQDVVIPDSVITIDRLAFEYCGCKSIKLSKNLVTIDDHAFEFCTNLESIEIPDSVTKLGHEAFYNCTKLKTVKLGKGLKETGYRVFEKCGLENVDISDQTEVINRYAFAETNLEKLSIPDSVTEIQYSGFYTDTLEEIEFSKNLKKVSPYAFSTKSKWYLNQPDGVVYAGPVAYKYKGQLPENQTISIKDGTTALAEAAFANSSVHAVTLPESITYIGKAALANCENLKEIQIPYGIEEIDKYALGYKVLSKDNTYVEWYDVDVMCNAIERGAYVLDKVADFTIKGYAGTAAETYAKENGFTFVNLAPTEITLDQTNVTIHKNETVQLHATIAPEIAKDATVIWSTTDPAVATVSENGLVTAYADGTAKITAKTVNGISAVCTITVCGTRTPVTIPEMEGTDACLDITEGLTEVPDSIKELYSSVDQVTAALKDTALAANSSLKADKASVKMMDVELKIQAEDGSWKLVDDNNFPKNGVTIVLPYPEGTDKDNYDFTVAHMLTSGKEKGTVEILNSEKTEEGLKITVHSLSPIAIVYQQSEKTGDPDQKNDDVTPSPSNPGQTTPDTKPETKQDTTVSGNDSTSNTNVGTTNANVQKKANDSSAKTNTKKAPITGDAQNVVFWMLLLGGAALAVVVCKKNKNRV